MSEFDLAVIGAGFGGLGAALEAAERGARVVVCEALDYPGGCAGTYSRDGYRFEAGATLMSGLGEGQLFRRWLDRHRLDLALEPLDPVVELRAGDGPALPMDADRATFEARLLAGAGERAHDLQRFLDLQRRVADALWPVLDNPQLLPPLGLRSLLTHARRLPRYAPLVRLVGKPLEDVLKRFGVARVEPLRTWLDAICQITVQCPASEAEAPFALAAMDYLWRGAQHVRGGVGELARALVRGIEQLGGEVRYTERVKGVVREGERWRVTTRRGDLRARHVAANLLPQDLGRLLEGEPRAQRRLAKLAAPVEGGWGACMLYRVAAPPPGDGGGAHHLELVDDPGAPFTDGNHVFVSISSAAEIERAPAGWRTLTCSTHVQNDALLALPEEAQAARVAEIQAAMRATLTHRAPEWEADVRHELTASPRTFQRFTRRADGLVGGVPRRAGWSHYRALLGRDPASGLALVGDSVPPGQSALATAAGGARVAARLLR